MMAGTDIDWLCINMKSSVTTVYLLLMSGLLSRPAGSQRELSEPCSFPLTLRTTEWPWKILSPGIDLYIDRFCIIKCAGLRIHFLYSMNKTI